MRRPLTVLFYLGLFHFYDYAEDTKKQTEKSSPYIKLLVIFFKRSILEIR